MGKRVLDLIQELELLNLERQLGLLLGLLASSDSFTEKTRVLTIKGSSERLGERRPLKVARQHAGPGDRLQKSPMQTNRSA